MDVFVLIPLIATVVYIPLLLTTAGSRPWNKRHTLFIVFLVSAMFWSLADYFFRANFFPDHKMLLLKIIMIAFPLMATQIHVFSSTYFIGEKGRWLPYAYISLGITIGLVLSGQVIDHIIVVDNHIIPQYKLGIYWIVASLLVLAIRNFYALSKKLRVLTNPAMYSQTLSLMLGIGVLLIFVLAAILPHGREYPIPHIGNIINAIIFSYSVIRHRLVDIRLVLRQGTALISMAVIGGFVYWLLLAGMHEMFGFQLDLSASVVAVIIGLFIAVFLYRIRGVFFQFMTRAFQRSTYDYRRQLAEFSDRIHNIFSLKEQGGELLSLLIKAINIKDACLLFPEPGSEDFYTQFAEPKGKENQLSSLRLRAGNPIIRYLERERKSLPKDNLSILPAFLGLWPQEKEEIASKEIEMFIPLISRDRLVAILVLAKKHSGRYSLEDLNIIEDVTSRVAVSIEKEYLREQLREREEELQVINASSAILSSSMDIQEIFNSFIEELRKVIDVSWASIILVEEMDLTCIAVSSSEGLAYQVGDRLPMEGTGTGWVLTNKRTFIESDLSQGMHFNTGDNFYQQGFRTIVYLPLIAKGKAIGTLIIAGRQPNAYNQQQIKLLEQLASQIAMPLEHTQLYAKAEQKARVDELTRLYNRRSLDEMIDNEISRHSRYGGAFSLAILDLDSFKKYNDSLGHLSGDKLLRQVGQIIKDAIRSADSAFRYGGDEFALLLPQTDIDDAFQVVERVRQRVAEEFASGEVPITTSIGLASWPDDGITHSDIIASADVTLYRAKRSGGNQAFRASGAAAATHETGAVAEDKGVIDNNTLSVVYALSETVDSKSYYNYDHSRKVADYALALAKMLNMETSEVSKIEACALLHDIGKISISEEILNKTGDLTVEEQEIIKAHPVTGAEIAGRIPQIGSCVEGIRYHHENYDGSGYPDGLSGEDIPLEARIVAVADTFTALTSEGANAKTMSREEALVELGKYAGKRLDPQLVEKFVSMYSSDIAVKSKKARR